MRYKHGVRLCAPPADSGGFVTGFFVVEDLRHRAQLLRSRGYLWSVEGCTPILGLKRRKAVCETRLVAAHVALAVGIGRGKIAARTRPALVDRTGHRMSDLAIERDAARPLLIRALHRAAKHRHVDRHFDGDTLWCDVIGLAPVEGAAVEGAARATGEARIPLGRFPAILRHLSGHLVGCSCDLDTISILC